MDRRRKRVAGTAGALWTLENGHLTRGGDIERSKRFVETYELPAGTFSLAGLRSQLYTFGSADLAATTPLGVQYQRLQGGHASAIFSITAAQNAANTETVVIGAKTYVFQTVLTNVDGHVLIGASRTASLLNLAHAINGTGGTSGVDYAALTVAHTQVTAVSTTGSLTATAISEGVAGNAIAVSETVAQGSWSPAAFLAGGGAATMTRILDVKPFQGKLYVVAEYDDGSIFHYYNGARVTGWDGLITPTANDVAERLAAKINRDAHVRAKAFGATIEITARVPGTAYTISGSATDGSGGVDTTEDLTVSALQANVAAVVEVRSKAVFEITGGSSDPGTDTVNSVQVNGVEILAAAVDWAATNAATAIRVAAEINNGSATHGYVASVVSAIITITAAVGLGVSPNGFVLDVTVTGTVTVTADAALAGGVDAVTAVAQVSKAVISGLIETTDTFTVTINTTEVYKLTGLASGMGTSAYVDKERIWSTAGRLWRYCDLGDATNWTTGDAGFIDLSETTEATDNFVTATRYQSFAAVLSPGFTIIYTLDVNPANVAVADTLDGTGTDAPKSVVRFGNNDTFYLDVTGIRSVRARDASNAPFVSDVGNAIDSFVQQVLATLTPQQAIDAYGAIEPRDGRFWLAAGGYIFVLSYFPTDRISAWSYYLPDEFAGDSINALVRIDKQMYVRAGDDVFLYGGVNGTTYPVDDESVCTVYLPFLSAGADATFKEWNGFDIACVNTWEIDIAYDPNDEARTVPLGRITKTTFNEMDSNLNGMTTMVAPQLTCSKAGIASISSMALHYTKIN